MAAFINLRYYCYTIQSDGGMGMNHGRWKLLLHLLLNSGPVGFINYADLYGSITKTMQSSISSVND